MGEKDFEEFYTNKELLDMDRFDTLGVIKNELEFNESQLDDFEDAIIGLKATMDWSKKSIVAEFFKMIPRFAYNDIGKYLDGKM